MKRKTRKAKKIIKPTSSGSNSTVQKSSKKETDNSNDYDSDNKLSSFNSLDTNSNNSNDRLLIDESNSDSFGCLDSDNATSFSCSSSNTTNSYLFIELKLISIDTSCVQYTKLSQNFLCINSNANASHLKSFLLKKMSISHDLFEVMFKVCPNLNLKFNKFFISI